MVLACIFAFDIACYLFRFATRTLLEGHGLVQVGPFQAAGTQNALRVAQSDWSTVPKATCQLSQG